MYASPSARCHANSPNDRPPGSGRKSYCVGGNACRSFTVLAASRSHEARNVSSSFMDIEPPFGYFDITRSMYRTVSLFLRAATYRRSRHQNDVRPFRNRQALDARRHQSGPDELEVRAGWRGDRSDELEPVE